MDAKIALVGGSGITQLGGSCPPVMCRRRTEEEADGDLFQTVLEVRVVKQKKLGIIVDHERWVTVRVYAKESFQYDTSFFHLPC